MPVIEETALLRVGDNLSRDDFLRRWDAIPDLKFAELINGVVLMPSPLSLGHGATDFHVATWAGMYAAQTEGVAGGQNTTWLMMDDSPQPDVFLRILQEYGGQSTQDVTYPIGAPEWLAEVCVTSAAYDLHQKLELHEKAGVREYLAVLLHEQEIRWHRLADGEFKIIPPDSDGIHRSKVFPGLWLDGAALFAGRMDRVLAVLAEGMKSPEYRQFVDDLKAKVQ